MGTGAREGCRFTDAPVAKDHSHRLIRFQKRVSFLHRLSPPSLTEGSSSHENLVETRPECRHPCVCLVRGAIRRSPATCRAFVARKQFSARKHIAAPEHNLDALFERSDRAF